MLPVSCSCLGDLTWYSIRFALFAFQWELPSHASCDVTRRSDTGEGVPTEANVTLYYPDGRRGVFTNGFHFAFRQAIDVTGTKGVLQIDDFVLNRNVAKFTVTENPGLSDYDRVINISNTVVEMPLEHGHQEGNMWRTFCGLVSSGQRDRFWPCKRSRCWTPAASPQRAARMSGCQWSPSERTTDRGSLAAACEA